MWRFWARPMREALAPPGIRSGASLGWSTGSTAPASQDIFSNDSVSLLFRLDSVCRSISLHITAKVRPQHPDGWDGLAELLSRRDPVTRLSFLQAWHRIPIVEMRSRVYGNETCDVFKWVGPSVAPGTSCES